MLARALILCTTLLLASGCARLPEVATTPTPDLVAGLVPGCPVTDDGQPSECAWRRAIWAAAVWEEGALDLIITSGGAVHSPWVESQVSKAALVALGVPADRVLTETQALHTDENAAYSVRIARTVRVDRLVSLSEHGQAVGLCQMTRSWGVPCSPASLDEARVRERLAQPLPRVDVPQVADWVPWKEQERRNRAARGLERPRPPSAVVYLGLALRGTFGPTPDPPVPPRPEPTLVDSPWVQVSDEGEAVGEAR